MKNDNNLIGYHTDLSGKRLNNIYRGDKVIREKSIDYLNLKCKNKQKGDFILRYQNKCKLLSEICNNSELLLFYKLTDYLKYNDLLIYKKNGLPIRNINDVIEISKMSKQTTLNSLKRLIDLKIIYSTGKKRNNYYFINPIYMFKGHDSLTAIKNIKDEYNINIK